MINQISDCPWRLLSFHFNAMHFFCRGGRRQNNANESDPLERMRFLLINALFSRASPGNGVRFVAPSRRK